MSRKTLFIHRLRICRKYGFKRFFHLPYLPKEVAISSHLKFAVDKNADQACSQQKDEKLTMRECESINPTMLLCH